MAESPKKFLFTDETPLTPLLLKKAKGEPVTAEEWHAALLQTPRHQQNQNIAQHTAYIKGSAVGALQSGRTF